MLGFGVFLGTVYGYIMCIVRELVVEHRYNKNNG